jgi:site-specific DNA recombinase
MTSQSARRSVPAAGQRPRAVLYLRVSTPGQVNTDYNPEGISLPAQREAGQRKAAELSAEIVREFIEPGKSARTIEKRPTFQEMLAWVKAEGDIDYIIVYHFNRVFRNSIDAAITKRDLQKVGTRVISTVLHLDDSPESKMIETIMHAVDQYQSEASGADISYKMGQKVKNGGSVGIAKLGYLNVRERVEGREVRTVVLDPERAPLVRQAFELFATGQYSGVQLQALMADAGLRTRGDKRRLPTALSLSRLYVVLSDRYYLGVVTHHGEEYPGRHEPLVTPDVFERVQRVLALRGGGGTRARRHEHYLKGALWCRRCGSRLVLNPGTGNGGTYFYFFCVGRRRRGCTLPLLPVDAVAKALEVHYATVRLSPDFQAAVRAQLDDLLRSELAELGTIRARLRDKLGQLDRREDQYLDLLGDPTWPHAKIKAKLAALQSDRQDIERQLAETGSKLDTGRQFFLLALDLLADPHAFYRAAGERLRRSMNSLIFQRLYVDEDGIEGMDLAAGFRELIQADRHLQVNSAAQGATTANSPAPPTLPLAGRGLDKAGLVEVAGIEPASSGGLTGLLRAQLVMSLLGPTGLPSKPV